VLGHSLAAHGTPLRTPKGMGDLLPPEANARRVLTRVVLETFELAGYDLITTPLFEHAEVVERGSDSLDPRDLLRFVEPESGEVAVLRPDITPQIARVIATRMAGHPAPWRLCYEGRVIRRRRGRARSHQQITQAGVECVGIAGPEADTEIVWLANRACEDAGLPDFRIELSQVTIAQSVLDTLPAVLRAPVSEALARKDRAALAALLQEADVPAEAATRLLTLTDHYGDLDVIADAKRVLRWPAAQAGLANLEEIVERLAKLGLEHRLGVDLSDARGSSYYTGMSFAVLAEGPGEPVGMGGRYDRLLRRFGTDQPATGFAFDLENLQWALRSAGVGSREAAPLRLVVAGGTEARRHALATRLRQERVVAATLPHHADVRSCLAFTRAWGYDAALVLTRTAARFLRTRDAAEQAVKPEDIASIVALRAWAQESTKG
jgi:ATP phosphoribosyltransferase regulatory subunit